MRILVLLSTAALLACASDEVGSAAATPAVANWHNVATSSDRERLRNWRDAWTEGLEAARAGNAAEIAAEGVLLDPDAALAEAAPPPGEYRCRMLKIGAKIGGPARICRLSRLQLPDRAAGPEGPMGFTKLTGSQRPIGRLFPDQRAAHDLPRHRSSSATSKAIMRYGRDTDRDMVALVERIGDRRWRLVFPYPHFESVVDVIELVPRFLRIRT